NGCNSKRETFVFKYQINFKYLKKVKADTEHIIKVGKSGNKLISVGLIVLLIIMGTLSLILTNTLKLLYSTAVTE
ncbi:MAG: hypothetical protein QMD06_04850, partial [Candidatus Altarchaeum sp.]|nr:hypothetical protein [Candidatus Altarchaeum sp.]